MDDAIKVISQSPGRLIRVAQQVHTALWEREVPEPLTSVQLGTLLVASNHPGISMSDLGARMSIDKVTAGGVVHRLTSQALLCREQHPTDRRTSAVTVTGAGEVMLRTCMPAAVRVQELLLEPVDARHRARLLQLLVDICDSNPSPLHGRVAPAGSEKDSLNWAPGYLIRRAQQVHVSLWKQIVSREFTSVQYAILFLLKDEKAVEQSLISSYISLDRSTNADVLARLERRGLVSRQRHPRDSRRYFVTATPAGRALAFRFEPEVNQVQSKLLGTLSPVNRMRFLKLMGQLCTGGQNDNLRLHGRGPGKRRASAQSLASVR